MYICAIANQKGGVGKTTTTQNLGVMLARNHGKRVLLLDLDAQGNLTDSFGLNPKEQKLTSFNVLNGDTLLSAALVEIEAGLKLLPANIDLAVADMAFAAKMGRENLLRKALQGAQFDIVLLDCPPSLGLLTVNALSAADGLLVPVQAEYHALSGLQLIRETVSMVQDNLNSNLALIGLVLTFYDQRKKLNRDVADALADEWSDKVFTVKIRDNVSLAEAPSNGQDIYTYKAASYGTMDYAALAKEFLTKIEE
ncbi:MULTISPECIES: ParA family protein [Desulfovibrio]|uniref:Chromosome partitioning protein n=1 Tax=Desulfovibrio desulfuricans TaxID=876 RepID=A0AA94HVH6_DESDE|nr:MULTISPECIES: ParA family protein [Desulfovibrio]ATD80679.1 ParA family protein [Desulfovibrio sp. G11]SFW75530.1 chromosome partitioning protein [Desulfovibrio desulfuricans]SPD36194.1 P-loop containing nucleoside triphosphate hydrolase [Desulfovibrio sp. G11]